MENNKGLVIVIIILGVLVVIMGGYIWDDIFNESNDKQLENNNIVNNNDRVEQEETSEKEFNNNTSVSCETNTEQKYTDIDYSDLNDMGTGIVISRVSGTELEGFKINVYDDGKLYYENKSPKIKKEIPVSNVIKLVSNYNYGVSEPSKIFYILNKEGQVYSMDEKDILNGNLIPNIVTGIPKFVDLSTWYTCKPGAGCGTGVFGITAEGKAHPVTFGSL